MAAKWSWAVSGSAWSNTTEQTVFSVAARVTKIEIIPHASQSATAYIDFWDNANPTPGTTTPFLRIPVNSNTVRGLQRKISVVFPNGGVRFGTACTAFASSNGGATAVLTTTIPADIIVYYAPGN